MYVFKFSASLKWPRHIASYALENRSICKALLFFVSHTFQSKRYISIVHTGNVYTRSLFAEMILFIDLNERISI